MLRAIYDHYINIIQLLLGGARADPELRKPKLTELGNMGFRS